jgi:hypothetical protein
VSAATTTLLAELAQRGITVRAADGRLACSPASALTDDLRRRLAAAKTELIIALSGAEPASSAQPRTGGADTTGRESRSDLAGGSVRSQAATHPRAPLTPCRACGSPTFWAMKGGATWICNGCHKTDFQPDQVEWHVVEDARRIMAVTRPKIGCPKCKFSGFVTLVGGRWTACVCNDGFERRVAGETDRGVA